MKSLSYTQSRQTGFTLIELLVVIAIVGILSSVVLTNIQDARMSARDTAVIQEARQMMTMAELIYSKTGTYNSVNVGRVDDFLLSYYGITVWTCDEKFASGPNSSELRTICNNMRSKGGKMFFGAANYDYANEYFDGTFQQNKYSIIVMLPSAPNKYFCLSSNGNTFHGEFGTNGNNWADPIWDPPHPAGCPYNP